MNKLSLAAHSRTIATLVLLVAISVIPQLKETIADPYYGMVVTALGIIAGYFHISPSQNYGYTEKTNILE